MGDPSQTAIADFLGITPNTVKPRLHSARQRLRTRMTDIERELDAARPSSDPRFAERIRRMIQPEALKQQKPWMWSPGIGAQVWEMFCACILGDLETVKRLLDEDPSLVRAHYEYRTPLSFAVKNNHLAVAEYLLDHGALEAKLGDFVEMAKDRGYAEMVALIERKRLEEWGASGEGDEIAQAIRDYDLERVRSLLDARPELLRAGDRSGTLPIHWAVMTRNLAMIDELVARGADLNMPRGDHALPIHLTNGDYDYRGWRDVPDHVKTTPGEVLRHLIELGAEVDLGMAAYMGDLGRVRELLARDPSAANRLPPYNAYYAGSGAPLKNAVIGGNIEIVTLLLEHGADPNLPEEGIAPQGHALYSAVYNGHYEIAKLLLERGAYPNPQVESSAEATWIAIRRRDLKMLALLGSYGAVMKIPIDLPLGIGYKDLVRSGVGLQLVVRAYYGDVDGLRALVEAEPALADDPEALEAAAGKGHERIVKLLLAHAPDLAKRVRVTRPRKMVELLFKHGMDPNRPDWMRITQLHQMAREGDIERAALFLDHGADIHARDEEHSSTPLAWAAREGRTQMVEYLLRRGAKPTLPDDPPWATPLAWAKRRGHDEVVRVLERCPT
jgi:ankyrin repeat protein